MAKSKKTKNAANPNQSTETPSSQPTTPLSLSSLRENHDLWYKIRVLIYDLRNVAKDHNSEQRTLRTTGPLCISAPYFSAGEAAAIKSTVLADGTTFEHAVAGALANFFEKRRASGDARPCGPHDMAPIYQDVLGIETQELEDERFLSRLRRCGVDA